MIALGVALQARGHAVRFATSPPFREEIEASGLEFVELPPRWTQEELSYWMGRLQHISIPLLQLRELYRAAVPHVTDLVDTLEGILETADILVSSYLFPMNRAIADRHGLPFATFAFAHNTVPSHYYPPEGLPRLRRAPLWLQRRWNRTLWRLGNLAVDSVINLTIARQLKARGLPPVKDFFSKPAKIVLVAVSPGLMKPKGRLHPRFRFVGYCRWQNPPDPALEAEIEAFTGGEPVPVLTFGSMVYDDPGSWMRRLAQAWPRDRKLIVQRGWAGFEAPPDCPHFKVLGPMCHDQLFGHASVVIHHGGAGTTASVLKAGRPHLIVPHIADQNFFAQEVKRLHCGRFIKKKRWPEQLAGAVEKILSSKRIRRHTAEAQRILESEDGTAAAIAELEAYVAGREATRT